MKSKEIICSQLLLTFHTAKKMKTTLTKTANTNVDNSNTAILENFET